MDKRRWQLNRFKTIKDRQDNQMKGERVNGGKGERRAQVETDEGMSKNDKRKKAGKKRR